MQLACKTLLGLRDQRDGGLAAFKASKVDFG
jgi:hypothetical protein